MKPWMMWDGEYQSEMCWEFSELITRPCHSLTVTAFTDGRMPQCEEDGALQRDEAKHGEDDLGAGDVIWVRI